MRSPSKIRRLRLAALVSIAAFASTTLAAPGDYSHEGMYSFTPPGDSALSWSTSLVAFPADSTRRIDGYPLASRLLAATGFTVSIQAEFGGSEWLPVAVMDPLIDPSMDPAFLAITPDGETIALGCGADEPLYVFATTSLSTREPFALSTMVSTPSVTRYDLYYYDGAFRDNRWLFVNAGGSEFGTSHVFALDTKNPSAPPVDVLFDIPGASSGIAFDAQGNLVTGIGWDADDMTTGNINLFPAAAIDAVIAGGDALDYDDDGLLLAEGMLSAASLGFDAEGNLFIGGGDAFGSSGNYGYANLVSSAVVTRVLEGGDPANPDVPGEITELQPDPCRNDDATRVTYVPGVDMLLVSANLTSPPDDCAMYDWSDGMPRPTPVYFPPTAPDDDGDGIPNGVDPDFGAREMYGTRLLSRLVNALDAEEGDPNFDAGVDFDESGVVDDADAAFLRARWSEPLPNR